MLIEDNDLEDIESENKDDKNLNKTVEDIIPDEDNEDDEKKENLDDIEKDPYEKKLADLTAENRRKGTALSEKNLKIKELKKQLSEQGLDTEQIKGIVDEALSQKLEDLDVKSKKLDELISISKDNAVNDSISKFTKNDGEKKIVRFYFDNKVNKDLPFHEQIQQAVVLADNAMKNDVKFQEDVKKANQQAINTTSKNREGVSLSENAKNLRDALLTTKEGKAEFDKLMSK
ncbi:MAG: hypothetical protein WC917_00775 [Bacilli bacterium]|jgi:hypothetical protein